MMTRVRLLCCAAAAALAVATALACATARADEDAIHLTPGTGADLVTENCAACHSLDYIQMNSPFLDRKGWTAEVGKMVKVFGAPIAEADQTAIVDYLTANYGKP